MIKIKFYLFLCEFLLILSRISLKITGFLQEKNEYYQDYLGYLIDEKEKTYEHLEN